MQHATIPSLSGVWAFYSSSLVESQNAFTFGGQLQSDASGNINATLGIGGMGSHCIPDSGTATFTEP